MEEEEDDDDWLNDFNYDRDDDDLWQQRQQQQQHEGSLRQNHHQNHHREPERTQERDHHHHHREDATFDANAPSPIVKIGGKKGIASSRYAEETPPRMNGYDDGGDDTLTPASYLGTTTPQNENYSNSNTNLNNNNNNNNNNNVIEGQSASKPSDDTVDDWLNDEATPPMVQHSSYNQGQGQGQDIQGQQEQQHHNCANQSQLTSSPKVLQHSANFDGLFAGNDDDAAFFDTLGGGEETIAAAPAQEMAPPPPPPPPPHFAPLAPPFSSPSSSVPVQNMEEKGVASVASTAASAVDVDFLNDFADGLNPPTQMPQSQQQQKQQQQQQQKQTYIPPSDMVPSASYSHPDVVQMPPTAASIPPPTVTQPAIKTYESSSEFGIPPSRMFTPPPPQSISTNEYPAVVQQQISQPPPPQAAVYEPPSEFGAPPSVPPQVSAYEPPSEFGAPPSVPPQTTAYEPPSEFGVPPPIVSTQQNQPQQFQQHESNRYASNSSMQALAQPGTDRSPDGKPSHRCIAFGFGGMLATVSRTHENSFSLYTHSNHDMFRLSDNFSAREFVEVASDETFFLDSSENETTDESLCSKCEHLARDASQMIGESELWKILSLFLSRKKSFDSLRSFGEVSFKADVASLLHVQNRAESASSSLSTVSASERDVSPAILMEIERQISLGNTIAALDIAHTHKLWNVAMKVARLTRDETIISDTCLRGIQETMQVGTPLRVLELLSIGRADVAVKDLLKRNNGKVTLSERWREVIATVSLNSNERDKTITNGLITLGDACRENNYLCVAHLCYLLSGEVWPNDISRMHLIGSNDSPYKDPRAYHRALLAERIVLSSAKGKGSEALKALLSMLLPHQRMKVCYCMLLADFGHFNVALATLKNVQKNLKLVRDDSCSDSGVSVDVILAEAVDLEKRIREKLGQGVIKGKIANVGKKIAGGLSRFVGGTVDALFGGDDGDMGTSRGLDTPPQPFHQRPSSQDAAFQAQRSSSSLESVSNQPPPQQNPYHQQHLAHESANHSRSHSLASLDERGPDYNNYSTGEKYPSSSQTTYSGQQQQQEQQQQQQPGVPFKLVKSFSKLFSAAVPAPDKPYEGPKVAPQETADGLPENTFYYDENLKQWVDKSSSGAQPAAPEAPPLLAPPPTTAPGVDYYRSGGGVPNSLDASVGARYVSTFNTGEGQPNFQQSVGANNVSGEFQEMRLE